MEALKPSRSIINRKSRVLRKNFKSSVEKMLKLIVKGT